MKIRHRTDIEEMIDDDEDHPLFDEGQEYSRRKALGECTCDLLEPFGHVTCPACNESLSF